MSDYVSRGGYNEISSEDFRTRLSKINLKFPQNVGKGFLVWWCATINKMAPHFRDVTPPLLQCWIEGRYVPSSDIRSDFLNVADEAVQSDTMTENDFLNHVRYCKEYMEVRLEGRPSSLVEWADKFFLQQIAGAMGCMEKDVSPWFGVWEVAVTKVPASEMRMSVIHKVAKVASDVVARAEHEMS